jgi:hypothetical protein|uniref:Uncharacterized protein n=1 Tax=Zea mays TaxID=4577 RepID=A0A804NMW2_MAIZE
MDADAVEKLAGAIAIANKAVKEAAARGEKRRRAGQAGRRLLQDSSIAHLLSFSSSSFFFDNFSFLKIYSLSVYKTPSNHTEKRNIYSFFRLSKVQRYNGFRLSRGKYSGTT